MADTNNRSASWREAMYKTIDVIAHGRERFENGGSIAKRDVLLALGSNPTLFDGRIELTRLTQNQSAQTGKQGFSRAASGIPVMGYVLPHT